MPDLPWQEMDQAARDAAYDNRAAVPGSGELTAGWSRAAQAFRTARSSGLDIAYGEREREKLDYFASGQDAAPLFVFIHGGYWQSRAKEDFSHFAAGPLARGFNVALPGYALAPDVRLRTIVDEIRAALTWLAEHAGELGFDPQRLFVGGWSAGGHLAAMMLDHPAVSGVLAVSGIFDLEPIADTYLNEALRLSSDEIAELSPRRRIPPAGHCPPLRLFVGGAELEALRRQSADYAAAARAAGLDVRFGELAGHNHFTILEELESAQGALVEALCALAEAPAPPPRR
ncbi:MAG: alpha/beta hydrolase [Methyloligellaceae bacterium]